MHGNSPIVPDSKEHNSVPSDRQQLFSPAQRAHTDDTTAYPRYGYPFSSHQGGGVPPPDHAFRAAPLNGDERRHPSQIYDDRQRRISQSPNRHERVPTVTMGNTDFVPQPQIPSSYIVPGIVTQGYHTQNKVVSQQPMQQHPPPFSMIAQQQQQYSHVQQHNVHGRQRHGSNTTHNMPIYQQNGLPNFAAPQAPQGLYMQQPTAQNIYYQSGIHPPINQGTHFEDSQTQYQQRSHMKNNPSPHNLLGKPRSPTRRKKHRSFSNVNRSNHFEFPPPMPPSVRQTSSPRSPIAEEVKPSAPKRVSFYHSPVYEASMTSDDTYDAIGSMEGSSTAREMLAQPPDLQSVWSEANRSSCIISTDPLPQPPCSDLCSVWSESPVSRRGSMPLAKRKSFLQHSEHVESFGEDSPMMHSRRYSMLAQPPDLMSAHSEFHPMNYHSRRQSMSPHGFTLPQPPDLYSNSEFYMTPVPSMAMGRHLSSHNLKRKKKRRVRSKVHGDPIDHQSSIEGPLSNKTEIAFQLGGVRRMALGQRDAAFMQKINAMLGNAPLAALNAGAPVTSQLLREYQANWLALTLTNVIPYLVGDLEQPCCVEQFQRPPTERDPQISSHQPSHSINVPCFESIKALKAVCKKWNVFLCTQEAMSVIPYTIKSPPGKLLKRNLPPMRHVTLLLIDPPISTSLHSLSHLRSLTLKLPPMTASLAPNQRIDLSLMNQLTKLRIEGTHSLEYLGEAVPCPPPQLTDLDFVDLSFQASSIGVLKPLMNCPTITSLKFVNVELEASCPTDQLLEGGCLHTLALIQLKGHDHWNSLIDRQKALSSLHIYDVNVRKDTMPGRGHSPPSVSLSVDLSEHQNLQELEVINSDFSSYRPPPLGHHLAYLWRNNYQYANETPSYCFAVDRVFNLAIPRRVECIMAFDEVLEVVEKKTQVSDEALMNAMNYYHCYFFQTVSEK